FKVYNCKSFFLKEKKKAIALRTIVICLSATAGKTLSHENTVVRVDTTLLKQQRRAAGISSNMGSPLPGSPL
ncbi:unnamed protein product, partial [Onchocerca flexuosa]|uniref:Secreted protein n=1 Tax=Onchocerca flexuosa TaxID=387005 RepID=A0A183H4K4_9BILA